MNPDYQVSHYDMTIPLGHLDKGFVYDEKAKDRLNAVIARFKALCKRYAGQVETGDDGNYVHVQARVSLIKKRRLTELAKLLNDDPTGAFKGHHLSKTTSDVASKNDNFYVLKDDQRFQDTVPFMDPTGKEEWEAKKYEAYVPRQVTGMVLRPFQQEVLDSAKVFDDRIIHLIFDPEGGAGKSKVAVYLATNGFAKVLPPIQNAQQLQQSIFNLGRSPLYIIDIPRSSAANYGLGAAEVYAAIEQTKDGYMYDTRYKFKQAFQDSPAIWVIANVLPPLRNLTSSRWKIHGIDRTSWTLFDMTQEEAMKISRDAHITSEVEKRSGEMKLERDIRMKLIDVEADKRYHDMVFEYKIKKKVEAKWQEEMGGLPMPDAEYEALFAHQDKKMKRR